MTFESLENDQKAVETFAEAYWRSNEARSLNSDDRQDVLQTARLILYKYPFDAKRRGKNGKPLSRDNYIRRILPTAQKAWQANEKLRREALALMSAAESAEFLQAEATMDLVPDPLYVGGRRARAKSGLLALEEYSLDDLQSPPYKVEFSKRDSPRPYSDNPYHVPPFKVLPRYEDVLAVATHGKHQGKRRKFGRDHLPRWTQEAMEDRRTNIGRYVTDLVPAYLAEFGFASLELRHKAIVSDVNKHGLSPKQVQTKRNITESTYYAYLKVLERRGWHRAWDLKKARDVLRYNPVYDRTTSFYSNELAQIENIEIGAVLQLAGPAIEEQLYRECASDEAVRKELRAVRRQLQMAARDLQAEAAYDLRLKTFISDLIERPIQCGVSFSHFEERFRLLPFKRRLGIFCEAVRRKSSIADVFDLGLYYADVLYSPEELQKIAAAPTLQDLFGLARAA